MTTLYDTASLMEQYRPGSDDHDWPTEIADLESRPHLDMVMTSIQEVGIKEPVLLGDDYRVWDGHHRIVAAFKLGISEVPVCWRSRRNEHDA